MPALMDLCSHHFTQSEFALAGDGTEPGRSISGRVGHYQAHLSQLGRQQSGRATRFDVEASRTGGKAALRPVRLGLGRVAQFEQQGSQKRHYRKRFRIDGGRKGMPRTIHILCGP